jgi:hypothetical protein
VERIGRSGSVFGGRSSLFILSAQALTGLTGAFHRSDRCIPQLGFGSREMPSSCDFGLWCGWSVLGRFQGVFARFCEGFSSPSVRVLEVVFVTGPRGVTEPS